MNEEIKKYGWGVDGFGRCHMCLDKGVEVLLCGLDGVSGKTLIDYYELHQS